MACGERTHEIIGDWNMEFVEKENSTYHIVLPDDTICTTELSFQKDTVYMQVMSDGVVVEKVFVGKYKIDGSKMIVINSYGKQKDCEFEIQDNIMTVKERDNPDKIIMRLKRARPKV